MPHLARLAAAAPRKPENGARPVTGGRLHGFKLTPKMWRIRREDFQAFGRVKHGDP